MIFPRVPPIELSTRLAPPRMRRRGRGRGGQDEALVGALMTLINAMRICKKAAWNARRQPQENPKKPQC